MELLGSLFFFAFLGLLSFAGWRFYHQHRLKKEFEELCFSNPKLHRNIIREINSYTNTGWPEAHYVEQFSAQIWAEYKKGFKKGLTAKEIYKMRKETTWGPF